MMYKALRITETETGVNQTITELNLEELDTHEVLVRVKYSALNFKDALSATGNKGVTRKYPHTPGIDAAGVVERSSVDAFKVGDEVIVTSYDLGMNHPGAFSQYISVPSHWVVPLPKNLTLKEAAAYGTAALTAAIGLDKLEKNGLQKGQNVVITGATGAVGSVAVKLFSSAGYEVSGKADKKPFLQNLGAKEVISREELDLDNKRPLLKPKYDAAFDVAGGPILEALLKQIKPEGSVAICGLVGSPNLHTTVFPFILNGINLLGINSAEYPSNLRLPLWEKLSDEWKIDMGELMHEHSMDELLPLIHAMLAGKGVGRAVIKID